MLAYIGKVKDNKNAKFESVIKIAECFNKTNSLMKSKGCNMNSLDISMDKLNILIRLADTFGQDIMNNEIDNIYITYISKVNIINVYSNGIIFSMDDNSRFAMKDIIKNDNFLCSYTEENKSYNILILDNNDNIYIRNYEEYSVSSILRTSNLIKTLEMLNYNINILY